MPEVVASLAVEMAQLVVSREQLVEGREQRHRWQEDTLVVDRMVREDKEQKSGMWLVQMDKARNCLSKASALLAASQRLFGNLIEQHPALRQQGKLAALQQVDASVML